MGIFKTEECVTKKIDESVDVECNRGPKEDDSDSEKSPEEPAS